MEIETEEIEDISGFQENANPEKLIANIDYINIVNLKKIDCMPNVNIHSIDGDFA